MDVSMSEVPPRSPNGDVPVLIVDDQAPFRSVARTVVALAPGFSVVAEAESGEQALDLAGEHHPGLVLMDINLPGINGIEASRRILTADPETTVILLSTYTQDDLPADARTCGAAAYVHKEDMSPALLRRIWDERLAG
jgi:two-component system, NarL family, invasion response regulator UvrY